MDFLNVFLAFVVAIGITCFAFWTTALLFAIYETLCDYFAKVFKKVLGYDKR